MTMERKTNILHDHPYGLKLFCCKHCLKEYRNKYTFAQHVLSDHDGQKTLHLCNVCHKIFHTKIKLHCHSVVNHKKKAKFYCKICKSYWINKDMFLAHISTHAGEKRIYKCVECDRKYKTIGKFKVHRALHFEKKLQGICQLCLKTFSNTKLLRMHKCEKHETSLVPIVRTDPPLVISIYEPYIQKQGQESVIQQSNNSIDLDKLNSRSYQFSLIQPKPGVPGSYHYKPLKSLSSKTFQCKVCGNFFLGRSVLSKHLKDSAMCAAAKHQHIMPGEKHGCEVCGKYFSSAGLLKQHQENKHKLTEQPNSSIDLSMLNGKNNELKPILPKNDLPVKYENKPLKDPAPQTFQCKVCDKFFSMKICINSEYLCKTCDKKRSIAEIPNPQSKHKPTCEKCGKTFLYLKRHMRDSKSCGTSSKKLCCEKCKEVFLSHEAFKRHLANPVYCKAYIKGQSFECEYCDRKFDKRGSFKLHMAIHIKERKHVCVKCEMKFVNLGHLTQHYRRNEQCREGEEYKKYLKESIKKEFKCDQCGRCDFINVQAFRRHRQVHTENVVCTKCNTKFQSLDNLYKHEKHSCMGDHPCQFCGKKGFRNRLQLIAHLKEHDQSSDLNQKIINDTKSFKCESCDMRFAREANRLQHQRHRCAAGLMCQFCAKSNFRDKREFRKHVHRHDPNYTVETENLNMKDWSSLDQLCNVCFESFDSAYFKEMHMAKVHGEDPKPTGGISNKTWDKCLCMFCGAVFADLGTLIIHEKTVHTAKVACDICGKSVRHRHMLMHKRKHTGEKPYKCETCGKSFKSRANQSYHQKKQKCGI